MVIGMGWRGYYGFDWLVCLEVGLFGGLGALCGYWGCLEGMKLSIIK